MLTSLDFTSAFPAFTYYSTCKNCRPSTSNTIFNFVVSKPNVAEYSPNKHAYGVLSHINIHNASLRLSQFPPKQLYIS